MTANDSLSTSFENALKAATFLKASGQEKAAGTILQAWGDVFTTQAYRHAQEMGKESLFERCLSTARDFGDAIRKRFARTNAVERLDELETAVMSAKAVSEEAIKAFRRLLSEEAEVTSSLLQQEKVLQTIVQQQKLDAVSSAQTLCERLDDVVCAKREAAIDRAKAAKPAGNVVQDVLSAVPQAIGMLFTKRHPLASRLSVEAANIAAACDAAKKGGTEADFTITGARELVNLLSDAAALIDQLAPEVGGT